MSKQEMLRVIDQSCTAEHRVRTHDLIINGEVIPVTFEYGKEVHLPVDQAVKFMKDGFFVTEIGSDNPIMVPALTNDIAKMRLSPDETVAKYDELTLSALKLRAAMLPGGEGLTDEQRNDKALLIPFIKQGGNVKEHASKVPDVVAEPTTEEIDLGGEEDDSVKPHEDEPPKQKSRGRGRPRTNDKNEMPTPGDHDFIGPVQHQTGDEIVSTEEADEV